MAHAAPVMTTGRLLPHQAERLFLTDGGIETSLIFDDGIELTHFAAFDLLRRAAGRDALERYYRRYLAIAEAGGFGFVLESPTWRANPDWASRLGYSEAALATANADAIGMMHALRPAGECARQPVLISGCVGPRGDGYVAGEMMSVDTAAAYHEPQIAAMAGAGCDLITAITMTNAPEAAGVVRAAARCGVPSVISFTIETDGRLPSGDDLAGAIAAVDAATGSGPAYYMINCAHPTHIERALDLRAPWTRRIGGLRANASCKSHGALFEQLPHLRVFGGCCGTDSEHVAAIAAMLQVRAAHDA